MLIILH